MAMLTVRNIDEQLKTHLRIRAAQNGCSMEEEVRKILRSALLPTAATKGIGSRLQRQISTLTGGIEVKMPARSVPRPAPDFGAEDQ